MCYSSLGAFRITFYNLIAQYVKRMIVIGLLATKDDCIRKQICHKKYIFDIANLTEVLITLSL